MKRKKRYQPTDEEQDLIEAALSTVAILGEGQSAQRARCLLEKLKRENV